MIEGIVVNHKCLAEFPACMTGNQVARALGLAEHYIPSFIRAGLLKPLGRPRPNCVKFFAKCALLPKLDDEHWLSKAVEIANRHCKEKNARRLGKRAAIVSPVV